MHFNDNKQREAIIVYQRLRAALDTKCFFTQCISISNIHGIFNLSVSNVNKTVIVIEWLYMYLYTEKAQTAFYLPECLFISVF